MLQRRPPHTQTHFTARRKWALKLLLGNFAWFHAYKSNYPEEHRERGRNEPHLKIASRGVARPECSHFIILMLIFIICIRALSPKLNTQVPYNFWKCFFFMLFFFTSLDCKSPSIYRQCLPRFVTSRLKMNMKISQSGLAASPWFHLASTFQRINRDFFLLCSTICLCIH